MTEEQKQSYREIFPAVIEGELMSKHVNFRIGGPATLYLVANTTEDLKRAVQTALRLGIPWYVFGGGSNLLVSDAGYDGVVIQAGNREISIQGMQASCEAGAIMSLVSRKVSELGLVGFEWATGVPGTIGGAVFGNAGCYGGEMKDHVLSVRALHLSSGEEREYTNEQCRFGYRDSLFKHEQHVILGCSLMFRSGDREASLVRLNEISAERKAKQPLGESSAGCMFKNVQYEDESFISKLLQEVDVPETMLASRSIAAGWLVEKAGLRGYSLGGISVSEKHGNFLVNDGTGTADQVAQVVSICQMHVRDRFGIPLHTEVQFLGF